MELRYDLVSEEETSDSGRKIIMHPLYLPKLPPWLDMKVFYIRVSNCEVDELTAEHLTVNHIPLNPDTILEVNGRRSSIYSDYVSSSLRRDRVDKNSEEAIFVSTDSIRVTGSVRFEVFDRGNLLLTGMLELCNGTNGYTGESKNHSRKWSMKCQSMVSAGKGVLKGKQYMCQEMSPPVVEVYIAGCFSGTPIILTKTLQLSFRKRNQKKLVLESIPEYGTSELKKEVSSEETLRVSEYGYKMENDVDVNYNSLYSREEYIEGEDGELSWFNAGVRVGVGIGLGICLGLGVGVGLVVRTYQATTRTFKRRLI